jgi:hypothetical protein
VFNGNAALSAKLMSMNSEPFAKVVITYYLPQPDAESMSVEASPPMSPEGLQTLQQRLREANFLVESWDLTTPIPWDLEDASEDGPPRVLLVLPAAKFMSRRMESIEAFESTVMGKVKTVIDGGTPAIFLSCYLRPQYRWMQEYGNFLPLQPNDFFGLYLRQDWGVELDSDYRILRVVPDERLPGKYQFDVFRYLYMPLSLFTDHPLGQPLRGQRMIWSEVCPVQIADALPERVRAEPVLAIPPAWQRDTWATNNILTVLDQWRRGRSGHVEPDFGPDADMQIPDSRPGLPTAQPIEAMSRPTWMVLWTLCVVVAPLTVVAAGGIVMIIRRS